MQQYQPSGRVHWSLSLLLIGAILVAMFVGRLVGEMNGYWMAEVLLIGLVAAGLAAALYFGKCRSPAIAVSSAIACAVIYLSSEWLAYYASRFAWSARTDEGFWPFFIDAVASRRFFSIGEPHFSGLVITGLGMGIVTATLVQVARVVARRAFYDEADTWASSVAYSLTPEHAQTAVASIDAGDWEQLAGLPYEARRVGRHTVRVEYLPGALDVPMYVTVVAPILHQARWLLAIVPQLGWFVRLPVLQRQVDATGAAALACAMPGLAPNSDEVIAGQAEGVLQYASNRPHPANVGALASVAREIGYLGGDATADGGQDFREAAVRASEAVLGAAPLTGPPEVLPSLCVRASNEPARTLRQIAWFVAFFQYSFAAAGLGAFLMPVLAIAMQRVGVPLLPALLMLGSMLCLLGAFLLPLFHVFLVPVVVKSWVIAHVRQRSILLRDLWRATRIVRIENARTFHVVKVVTEDIALCRCDSASRCLVLEGISHRYVIRADDVTRLALRDVSVPAVEVHYNVAGVPLELTLGRETVLLVYVSALSRFPILGWPFAGLMALVKRRELAGYERCIGPVKQPVADGAPQARA